MTPNERNTLHLEGTVENVLYCNPDNGYTVLELDAVVSIMTLQNNKAFLSWMNISIRKYMSIRNNDPSC